jgi:aminoglycoside phosphotransferase (APT) family kinase protein
MSEIRGLNLPNVKAWLAGHVEGADADLCFELITAGGSNLTYVVERNDGKRWALRRPPERARISTAHEMSREWKIIAALHAHPESGIPVPEAVAYCEDPEINGAEFYVMGFAEGLILRGPEEAKTLDANQCRIAAESLIDIQIAMANLDADTVGLGDLGRKEAYVERQLARWLHQFEAAKGRELPIVRELHEELLKNIPPQQTCGLVHGDYRFDNTVLGPDHRILAVLDWELCTLGDPVADFCWSILYWTNPGEETDFGSPSPTRHPAFPRREEVIELYAERSGFDLSRLDYYRAFSWWKMACLLEGVAARLRAGAGGGAGAASGIANVYARVDSMLELAVDAARKV